LRRIGLTEQLGREVGLPPEQ